ncbi:hypothetical protein G8A07_04990 [Roseateles sp. DAIF2]|uniref:hypothetical protein n=1 Tax=Roseateles sp. DAIF2 TaxID=2714952 RepID=UPI0018A28E10|nr:hypothetical protein [Roseateles sp. DAIF2]QPF72351.1 hypothetical protein G8A07_04990 [Roseateles sp. DAIF2]
MKFLSTLAIAVLGATAMVAGAAADAPAAHQLPANSIKNVVLVHGATVDGSYWEQVYRQLSKKG